MTGLLAVMSRATTWHLPSVRRELTTVSSLHSVGGRGGAGLLFAPSNMLGLSVRYFTGSFSHAAVSVLLNLCFNWKLSLREWFVLFVVGLDSRYLGLI